jgi:iron complex transport system substrate-binding protein
MKTFFLIFFLFFPLKLHAEPYGRVISLAPSITRSLYDLGADEKIVGVTKFRPEVASAKEIVGDLQNIHYEKLIAISPDIIFVKKDCTRPEVIRKIKDLGFKVKVFSEDKNIEEIFSQFTELSLLVGKEEKAREIVKEVRKAIQELEDKRKGQKRLSVFWQVGIQPVVAAGRKSFINDLLFMAGLKNIFLDVEKPYFIVNMEEVILRHPDMIFYISEMDDAKQAKDFWNDYPLIKAVKEGKVFSFDADLFCQPTPKRFVIALKSLIEKMKHLEGEEE